MDSSPTHKPTYSGYATRYSSRADASKRSTSEIPEGSAFQKQVEPKTITAEGKGLKPVDYKPSSMYERRLRIASQIPEKPPTMDLVEAKALVLGCSEMLEAEKYTEKVKVLIPVEKDWDRLCELNDFMKDNIDDIESNSHEWTAVKLSREKPGLYLWLLNLSGKEKENPSNVFIEYLALSADWCAVNYREDSDPELPSGYFHWRNLSETGSEHVSEEVMAVEQPAVKRKRKKTTVGVPAKRPNLEDAMASSMRLDVQADIVKTLAKGFLEHIPSSQEEEYKAFLEIHEKLIDQYQKRYEKNKLMFCF
ncbi:MAG: hypothetical protein ACR2PT_00405 [Endozoicomonas sp.]